MKRDCNWDFALGLIAGNTLVQFGLAFFGVMEITYWRALSASFIYALIMWGLYHLLEKLPKKE